MCMRAAGSVVQCSAYSAVCTVHVHAPLEHVHSLAGDLTLPNMYGFQQSPSIIDVPYSGIGECKKMQENSIRYLNNIQRNWRLHLPQFSS